MTFPFPSVTGHTVIKSRSHLSPVRFPISHKPWQQDGGRWQQPSLRLLQSASSKGKLILHRNLFCAVTCQPTISHPNIDDTREQKHSCKSLLQYHDGLPLSFLQIQFITFSESRLFYPVFASKSCYRLSSKVWISRPRAKLHEQSGPRLAQEQRGLAEKKVLWQVSMGEAAVR